MTDLCYKKFKDIKIYSVIFVSSLMAGEDGFLSRQRPQSHQAEKEPISTCELEACVQQKDTVISVRRQTVNPKKVLGDQRRYSMATSKFLQACKEKDQLRGKNNGK